MDGINDKDMWDLPDGYYSMPDNTLPDISKYAWNGLSPSEGELTCMFEENTPLKACADLPYQATSSDYMNKDLDLFRENSSQIKRRRMLQFDPEVFNAPLYNEDISASFLQSEEMMDSFEEALPDVSQWVSSFADTSASSYVPPDQSSDAWLTDCFGNANMQFSLEDMNLSGSSELQIDITEFCDTPVQHGESSAAPQEYPAKARPKLIFKGKKSYTRPPTKLASSVVYPFAFVKPCGVRGDVTLKDINQRIRTPPPSKSKKMEDPSAAYPTSALTGKPVIGKTKIRTEGGKGSITIMRTKG
ncbi:protein XRI1-like [Apium graveolens]|uniref:protein XRI1-like n=1 Tax=Apium graveolens TaxID=4045 RepID=UPI003D7A3745